MYVWKRLRGKGKKKKKEEGICEVPIKASAL